MRTFFILVAVCTTSVLAFPDISFAFYSVTDGLDPAKLNKDNVKIAVVKVKATRVVRPETRKQLADGSSTCMHAIYSIDLELVEQLYGKKLTEADLTDVSYSNVPEDNAWALGPVDPKGRYYIMAWRLGHPCGQASGVRFSPGPDLPVLIDKPDHPSVKLVKQLLAIVNSPVESAQRKAAIAAKLKELRNALGIQVPGLDPGVPTQRGSNNSADDKDTASADAREDWRKHLFPVDRNGKWGFIDASGKIVIEPAFEEVAHFSEGLAAVKLNGKYGYIDQTGKTVIEPRFDEVSSFFNGRASIVMDKKYGYINQRGEVVVEPRYGAGHFFLGELAGVTFHPQRGDGAGTGYVNRDGHVVCAPEPKAED